MQSEHWLCVSEMLACDKYNRHLCLLSCSQARAHHGVGDRREADHPRATGLLLLIRVLISPFLQLLLACLPSP